jgi:hypothetical protein
MTRSLLSVVLLSAAAITSAWGAQNDRVIPIAAEKKSTAPAPIELPFDLPKVPQGQQVRLSLDMRNDAAGYAGGFAWWPTITVNGSALVGPDLLNKRLDFFCKNGCDVSWVRAGTTQWLVLYSPDFSDAALTQPNPWGFFSED